MTSYRISRRRLLAGSGAFMTLPLLEALVSRRALADGTSDPRRLVMIHWPNGTVTRDNNLTWFSAPNGPLTAANAPVPLQPFTDNLSDITILKFLTQSARDATLRNGGGGHGGSKPCFFTGQVPSNLGTDASGITGDSFDVMYGKLTPNQRSIYLANSEQSNGDNVAYGYELSHKNGQKVTPEINPVSFFNTYFKNLTGTVTQPKTDYARNPKILDVPNAAATDLRAKLGKDDRVRLDAFLTSLGELKTNLAAPTTPVVTCSAPPLPAVDLGTTNQNGLRGKSYFDRMKAFNSLIAVGFQCDLFRSVAISFGAEGNYTTYDGVYPATLNYNGASLSVQYDHSVSHQSPISGEAGGYGFNPNMTRDRIHLSLVVDLINKLKAVTDPSGSKVLDNTIIMSGFCVDDGQHGSDGGTTKGSPVLVSGGKNFITPGRSLDASQYDLNDLYFTFSGLLGMGLANFHPIAQSSRPYGPLTGRTSGSTVIPL
jgi:Protein of unknown function (DUF1552)